MEKKECIFNLVVAIGLMALSFALVYHDKQFVPRDVVKVVEIVDTLVVRDTLKIIEPAKTKTIYTTDTLLVCATDTLIVHDTLYVAVPVTQEYYKGKDYEAWISGYKPKIDSLYVFPKTVYVNKDKTISVTSRKRFAIGIQAGYGATVHQSQVFLSPYIGIGVSYNFLQF